MLRLSALFLTTLAFAADPPAGTTERLRVHGRSLEGNLIGDSPTRDVSVYLPPSYAKSPQRRYPVVYMLHGFTDSDDQWFGLRKHWIHLPQVLDRATAAGAAEMIVDSNAPFFPSPTGGVRAYVNTSVPWANARSIWNQHAYVESIISELGVPLFESTPTALPGFRNARARCIPR
jgi:hypothetical protein